MKTPKISYKSLLVIQYVGFLIAVIISFIFPLFYFQWLGYFVLMFSVQHVYIKQNLKLSEIEKAAENPILRRLLLNNSLQNKSAAGLYLFLFTALIAFATMTWFLYLK
jgi:ABC-type multidrug transport system fused ATPase/permease subunit